MLESTVTLNPFGWGEAKKVICDIKIANIKDNGDGTFDYVYMIREPKSAFGEQVFLYGVIRNHKRNQPVVYLMQAIYADFGKSACEFSRRFVLDNWV